MEERKRIAVAGATGRVGHHAVEVLEAAGHDVVPMSRSTGVDVVTGEGLSDALAGVEVIVDAASWPSNEQKPATDFFVKRSVARARLTSLPRIRSRTRPAFWAEVRTKRAVACA